MGQTPRPDRTYNQLAGTSIDRLRGISDGMTGPGAPKVSCPYPSGLSTLAVRRGRKETELIPKNEVS